MSAYHPAKLTPSQRAGVVTFRLAQGDGLTIAQMRQLAQYPSYVGRHRIFAMLGAICNVVDVRAEAEVWAAYFHEKRGKPHSAWERAAWTAYKLAVCGEVRVSELSRELGVSRQATYNLLCKLACVLPLYVDGPRGGVWRVLDLRELDD